MSAQINHYKEQAIKMLHTKNRVTDALAFIESKTQVKREYLASGALSLLCIYLIFGYAAELICNLIAFVYPAYCSLKALETNRKEDDTRWLIYWVVFAIFSVMEFFLWIPFYWLVKCVFLVWCYAPTPVNGADFIYNRIVRPFFLKHQTQIDATMDKMTGKITRIAEEAASNIGKME